MRGQGRWFPWVCWLHTAIVIYSAASFLPNCHRDQKRMPLRYRIADISVLGSNCKLPTPRSGQIVALDRIRLRINSFEEKIAYKISKADEPQPDIWTETDYRNFPLFSPRWSGFDQLDTTSRECPGYLMTQIQCSSSAPGIKNFFDYSAELECYLLPA